MNTLYYQRRVVLSGVRLLTVPAPSLIGWYELGDRISRVPAPRDCNVPTTDLCSVRARMFSTPTRAVLAACLAAGIAGCGSTKTVTTTVTTTSSNSAISPDCAQAYKTTLQALELMSGDVRASAGYIPLIAAAAKAGQVKSASQFKRIEEREKKLNAQVGAYAAQVDKLDTSHVSSSACS
jgi:hypothetical protein